MNFWINSNTGDYISEIDGKYTLTLISRKIDGEYFRHEVIDISLVQFQSIKGFVPIKGKKLFSRNRTKPNRYLPTGPGGITGDPQRASLPTLAEARETVLNQLGIK